MGFKHCRVWGSPRVAQPILATRNPQIVEAVRRMLLERLRTDSYDFVIHIVHEWPPRGRDSP